MACDGGWELGPRDRIYILLEKETVQGETNNDVRSQSMIEREPQPRKQDAHHAYFPSAYPMPKGGDPGRGAERNGI